MCLKKSIIPFCGLVVDPLEWSGREGKRKGRQDEAAPAEARF